MAATIPEPARREAVEQAISQLREMHAQIFKTIDNAIGGLLL